MTLSADVLYIRADANLDYRITRKPGVAAEVRLSKGTGLFASVQGLTAFLLYSEDSTVEVGHRGSGIDGIDGAQHCSCCG